MRTAILATISAVALLAPVAALADPPAPQVVPAGAHPGEALICHYYYHEGVLVGRPICKTERAWIRERIRVQEQVSQIQSRSLIQHP
jgi:hypothetical protein